MNDLRFSFCLLYLIFYRCLKSFGVRRTFYFSLNSFGQDPWNWSLCFVFCSSTKQNKSKLKNKLQLLRHEQFYFGSMTSSSSSKCETASKRQKIKSNVCVSFVLFCMTVFFICVSLFLKFFIIIFV
ncbi:hypothetical protein NL108_012409 [Boleophthalmus pectinirostris]|nr:hypothetical protein NL108_012409 [Boleophthalmus pectinirostris]